MACDSLACDANGEIEVDDILTAINCIVTQCESMEDMCEKYSKGDIIRTYTIGNILYMTNDGSDPRP